MSYIPTSLFIFKSVIISSSSPILTSQLCAPYEPAVYIMFTVLNLILNCPGLKLAIVIHTGLPTKCPLPYIPCVPYISVQSSNVVQRHFWPVKAWDGWLSPPVLKVGNAKKTPTSPWFITYCFHLYDLACNCSRS